MRKHWGLLTMLFLGGCIFLAGVSGAFPKIVAMSRTTVAQTASQLGVQFPLVGRKEAASATPTESIVEPRTLQRTYRYHFRADMPDEMAATFEQAIAVYNDTGIVNLVIGDANARQNGITFFAYRKRMPTNQPNYLELGKGGPEIETVTGFNAYTANHARAGLNARYPQSIRLSVAVHEIGHALGLNHSQSRRSVMYPIDQGVTQLSTSDLKALRYLYAKR